MNPGAGSTEGDPVDDTSSDSSEQSTDSGRSEEDVPRRSRPRNRAPPPVPVPPITRNAGRRGRVPGRLWVSSQSARSNQDGQRRFEEKAAQHMRVALARRHHHTSKQRAHPGGVYARLEAEWRERNGAKARNAPSARSRPAIKYK